MADGGVISCERIEIPRTWSVKISSWAFFKVDGGEQVLHAHKFVESVRCLNRCRFPFTGRENKSSGPFLAVVLGEQVLGAKLCSECQTS